MDRQQRLKGSLGPLLLNTQGTGKPEGTAACAPGLAAGLGECLPTRVYVTLTLGDSEYRLRPVDLQPGATPLPTQRILHLWMKPDFNFASAFRL